MIKNFEYVTPASNYLETESIDFIQAYHLSHSQDNEADVSRGVLETPDKATPSRWRKQNIQRRKKEKAKSSETWDTLMIVVEERKLKLGRLVLPANTEENNKNNDEVKRLKTQRDLHHRQAAAMQNSLREEVESSKTKGDKIVLTFDLQQTLPTPSLIVGPAFYLPTYNLGVHDYVSGKATMFMWPEITAKQGSEEIASILLKYISSKNTTGQKDLVVFTDNDKNKNWQIMSLWSQLVRENKFRIIEHRFLISGHTYLPCDCDFALIAKHKKYLGQIYSSKDWFKAVQKSKHLMCSLWNKVIFSLDSIPISKKNVTDDKGPLQFNKVLCFHFESQNPNKMLVKHELNGNFKQVNIGKRGNRLCQQSNGILENLKKKYNEPVQLNSKKVEDLKKLMQYIPPVNQNFYLNIFKTASNVATEDIGTEYNDVQCVDGEPNIDFDEEV
ncbi:unnamed protein product [Psylliodes chrysocephalus]|uniref:DUF7869 domain-containing protein n=1 Tax=Psylliodes chrysocephalus TaxID=3402493 RepID=A0A9P0CJN5_9CUCU|nr:unnamed protein product [Psylliodes chrysocephala]